jgi:quinoprotein glucose dehydrogenase
VDDRLSDAGAASSEVRVKLATKKTVMRSRTARLAVAAAFVAAAAGSGSRARVVRAQPGPRDGDWGYYYGDTNATRYSPLAQITKDNIGDLRVAWRWASADRALQLSNPLWRAARNEETPIVVNGVMYTVTGLGVVAALDPGTGETRWTYDAQSYKAGVPNNGGFLQRGLAYWTDGSNERLFVGTADGYLLSVDARTGKPDMSFGRAGKADLTVEIHDAVRATNFTARRPTVAGNLVLVGSSIQDQTYSKEAPPGHVHAFDAKTGRRVWTFHIIPRPGEFGVDSWEGNSAEYSGSANVWSSAVYDPELGYVYLPTSTPTNNYYGGHRPGNNLFAESLICLEAKTGKRVWHFQAVHHGIWDYDFPTPPILGDITVDGRRIKALMQVSKQGFVYAFDRTNGQPIWPIEERPVPQSTVPGERTSPTQPFPTRPPAYESQGTTEDNLLDFTPELRTRALERLNALDHGPLFSPPTLGRSYVQMPGIAGGANWGGAAFDRDTGMLYVPSRTAPTVLTLTPVDPAQGNMRYVRADLSTGAGSDAIDGLPIFKPPYSRVTAINMNAGTLAWTSPLGNGPRAHPLLKGLTLPPLGDRMQMVSVLLTRTLLFVGVIPQGAIPGSDPDVARKLIYVFDKASGALLRAIDMDGFSAAAPMTYMYRGTQYVVVATGSGPNAELVAFSLPPVK